MAPEFGVCPQNVLRKPEPYCVLIPDQSIEELKTLLELSKIAPKTWYNEQTDGRYGISRDWLADAKEAWLHHFDWRQQEARINSFPNFKIPIHNQDHGQLEVHFVALFSTKMDALPIVFMHGWPGSFVEFLPILDLLRKKYTPDSLPYHVIVPSLPGFAFSSEIGHEKEFTLGAAAQVIDQLMIDLGFGKGYVAQGGDIDSMLSLILLRESNACIAAHINFLAIKDFKGSTDLLTPEEFQHLHRMEAWGATGNAYALEHSTRPATIGLTLSSSPLALLAWVGEKMLEWADEPIPIDVILTGVSLYWFTSTIPQSVYPYPGIASFNALETSREKPLGYSHFLGEVLMLPRAWAAEAFPNLVQHTVHNKGGHFAALEQPQALLSDVEEFVSRVGSSIKS